ncbi:hypothetical protein M1K46_11820 [Fictibacillus sp. WQ 8-8]|uniref:hypothetical protein n=1 Tax=Fictibacillus sp. WQ 8-8 TaxID=2938788 RepID=UPI0021098DFE|nr:hypothetical protein [Fictibacillus sp. WQ 8-8]MCQ6266345.1 hypothetical protein [Fictibacillus sp. WQ 8-8]
MPNTVKEFKTSIIKGPLAKNETLQSSAWAFMADIVKNHLKEKGLHHIKKRSS